MGANGSVVLSTLEFDVLWESERFNRRHVALDVPSPGRTHTERARLVEEVWAALQHRGLAENGRAVPQLSDQLALLANAQRAVDVWVWTDREIRGLAAVNGTDALLAVVDGNEVWLIGARSTSIAESAVSVTGDCPAGGGRSVSLPNDVLHAADADAGGDPSSMITALEARGVPLSDAQALAGMLSGIRLRGQFGVQSLGRDGTTRRAERIVSFHDTDAGRYLHLLRPSADGHPWSTFAPTDNRRLAACVWELLDEV